MQKQCKISYMAPFYDGTGYANFAIDTALSIDAANLDISCKNIKLATQTIMPPKRIEELCKKSMDNVTHNITHILPAYFCYHSGYKNIGLAHFETTEFISSSWQHYCNLLDELWVSCPDNKEACIKSGVKIPVKVIPKGCDPLLYNKTLYKPLPLPNLENCYKFYFIGDFSSRKNVINLIKAYFNSFKKSDQVVLILKTYVEATSSKDSINIIQQEINNIKKSIRRGIIDDFPRIILLTNYLSPNQILQLHAMGDCFISLERGSAWTIPAFDAIAMGNWTILNGWGGHTQYVNHDQEGWLLPYQMIKVDGMNSCPYKSLYYGSEEWADPNISDAISAMKQAFNEKKLGSKLCQSQFKEKYSYESIGKQIKEILK